MDVDPGSDADALLAPQSDLPARAQEGAAFPASAPLRNAAEVQEQEIAALAQELRGAMTRIHALEDAASVRDGVQVSLEDAHQTLTAQLHEQVETITALQEKVSTLRGCIDMRDAEIGRLDERLYLAQRELDQSRRESAAQVEVSCPARVCFCARLVLMPRFYLTASAHESRMCSLVDAKELD